MGNVDKSILNFVLENTTDGYWDWNLITNEEYLSPRFKSQLGYQDDEMENSPEAWQAICNPDDVKKSYEAIMKYLSGEVEDFSEILRFTHKKGHEISILCKGKIVERTEDGKPSRIIGTHAII